jgi:integrase
MSRHQQPPRLWLRPARRDKAGKLTHPAQWYIVHAGAQRSTGASESDRATAERALGEYLLSQPRSQDLKSPDNIMVAEVLTRYALDVVPTHTRPKQVTYHIERVSRFFAGKRLCDVNGDSCRSYARQSSTQSVARKDLEYLKAAIGHYSREGLCDRLVSVWLPDRNPARERFLTRDEAALFIRAAWRRGKSRHIARFAVVALYTGRRAGFITKASFVREAGRPWVDLNSGMLYPPARAKQTKKRAPAIHLPERLLSHLRRWRRNGQRYVVEWSGRPITRLDGTFKAIAIEAGLGDDVIPHSLRHTAASWMVQHGVDAFIAGAYLGMTTRILESTYGHLRPEHLATARNAITRKQRVA